MMLKKTLPLLLLVITTQAFPWSVSKLSREITSNKKREYTISVTSKDDKAIPIEVYIGKRHIDATGNDSYEKVDEHDFFIYPSVFVLQPGLSQKIRVRWTGDVDKLEKEQAYRIGVTEMPTKPKLSETEHDNVSLGLSFMKNFVGSVFIIPKKAQSHVNVVESKVTYTQDEDLLHLTLENQGKKHKLYKKPVCELSTKKQRFSFEPEIQGNTTVQLLGGQQRHVTIQLPPDWKEKLGQDKDFHISFKDQAE